jgi:hypothetical protein
MKALRWFGWAWIVSVVILMVVGGAIHINEAPTRAAGWADIRLWFNPKSPTVWMVNIGMFLPSLFAFQLAKAIEKVRANTSDTPTYGNAGKS